MRFSAFLLWQCSFKNWFYNNMFHVIVTKTNKYLLQEQIWFLKRPKIWHPDVPLHGNSSNSFSSAFATLTNCFYLCAVPSVIYCWNNILYVILVWTKDLHERGSKFAFPFSIVLQPNCLQLSDIQLNNGWGKQDGFAMPSAWIFCTSTELQHVLKKAEHSNGTCRICLFFSCDPVSSAHRLFLLSLEVRTHSLVLGQCYAIGVVAVRPCFMWTARSEQEQPKLALFWLCLRCF